MYKEIGKTWQSVFHEKAGDIAARAVEMRRGPTITRIDRPSRLDRARMLGYKAKEGIIVVRIKVARGGMRRKRPVAGRRPKHLGVLQMKADISTKTVAERRVKEKFVNMRVIGSYPLWKDGKNIWYEVILADPEHPSIKADYNFKRMNVPN